MTNSKRLEEKRDTLIFRLFVCLIMKLRQTMDVMCTLKSPPEYRPMPYDCLQRCGQNSTDKHLLIIRFEYDTPCKKGGHRRKKHKKTTHPPTLVSSNPIMELLHSRTEKKCVDALQKRKQKQTHTTESPHAESSSPVPAVAPITWSTWNMRAVAPIIQWLQKKRVRYIHSDWVNEFTNGERVCLVSQHGVVLHNHQITATTHYRCHSAFHGIQMQCARTAINVHNQNDRWWKEANNNTGNGLHTGILHSTYQQRIYVWDDFTYIYLTTADGQVYNVSVEHQLTDTRAHQSSLHLLLTNISYHLSKHTRQQHK